MSNLLPEQTITPAGQPTLLLRPPKDLFKRRMARFHKLSAGHSLEPWLSQLAAISEAQQTALDRLLAGPVDGLDGAAPRVPVTAAMLAQVASTYEGLVGATAWRSARTPAPDLSPEQLGVIVERSLRLAKAQVGGSDRDLTDVMVAAAMQVVWTAAAQHAMPAESSPANAEFCPLCASAAVGSIVLAGDGKDGLRYQQCCLCSSRWNVVRAHCTLCAEGSTVHYLSLEGQSQAIAAETCDHCHGYAKISFQSKDINVDPVADDLATLALDVLVAEEGFGRAAPNLFLCEGEALAS